MKSMVSCLLLINLLTASLLFASCTSKQAPTLTLVPKSVDTLKDQELNPLRDFLTGLVEEKEVPGVSLLIAQHGKIVFEEAYGWADIEEKRPFTTETIAWIRSTTKPLSATCVMILVDEGKISLDDPVSKYLLDFGELTIRGTNIKVASPTVRQLLSHTSGMVEGLENYEVTIAESVAALGRTGMVAEPGTHFLYGSASFQVAGRIVEIVSGQSFEVFMQEHLLSPLGMIDTTFRPNETQSTRVASVYNVIPGAEVGFQKDAASYHHLGEMKLTYVGGGLYSTLRDLAIFLQMHLNGGSYGSTRILSPAAIKEMQQIQTGDIPVYGLGWYFNFATERIDSDNQAHLVHHGGLFGAFAWVDMDRDLVGVFLTSIQPYKFAERMHRQLLLEVAEIFDISNR